jgi:hypothetical protein
MRNVILTPTEQQNLSRTSLTNIMNERTDMKNRDIAFRNERAYEHKQKEKRLKQQQEQRRARRNEKRGEF